AAAHVLLHVVDDRLGQLALHRVAIDDRQAGVDGHVAVAVAIDDALEARPRVVEQVVALAELAGLVDDLGGVVVAGVDLGVGVVGVLQRARERRQLERLVGTCVGILGHVGQLELALSLLLVGVGLERRDHTLGGVGLQAVVEVGVAHGRELLGGLEVLVRVVERVGVVVAVVVGARGVGEALEVRGVGPRRDLVLALGLGIVALAAQRLGLGLVIDGRRDERVLGQLERLLDRVGIALVGVVPLGPAQVV